MDPMLCMIFPWPATWAPMNFQFCQGQTVQIQQYEAAYSLLSILYGGDGKTNFMLPNLQGRALLGAGTSPVSGQYYQPATVGGVEKVTTGVVGSVTLAPGNVPVPAHSHPATFAPTSGSSSITIPAVPATSGTPAKLTATTLQANPAGGGNIAPSSTNNYIGGTTAGTSAANMWMTGLGTAPVTLGGLNVTLDPGTPGSAAIPAQTVSITTITGGSVTVGANTAGTGTPAAVYASNIPVMQPFLAMNFLIAMNGIYPDRP